MSRKPYPSDVTDAEWAFLSPYVTLMSEDAPQRVHPLRELLNGLRHAAKVGCDWRSSPHGLRELLRLEEGENATPSATILDGRVLRPTPESGHRAGYSGAERTKGSKAHLAVDTLGRLLALHVTPADVDERKAVGEPARGIQKATGESVGLTWVDQDRTGEKAASAAREHGIELGVVKLPRRRRASCSCLAGGAWSALSPGQPASADSPWMMRGSPGRGRTSTCSAFAPSFPRLWDLS